MILSRVAPPIALLAGACVPAPAVQPLPDLGQAAPMPSPSPSPTTQSSDAADRTMAEGAAVLERSQFALSGARLTQGGWARGRAPSGTRSATLGDVPLTLGPQGEFFAAFDRDAEGDAVFSASLEDGTVRETRFAIAPREWDIERVNVALRPSGSSEAFRARRAPELEAIWTARQADTGAQGWRQDFVWPVRGRISGRFGAQRIYRGEPGSYHSGLDIAAATGTPFVAPADGTVVLAVTDFSLEGQLLIIDHGQGLNSAFLHCSRILVSEGERVRQGQTIGEVGASGRATGPHMHWGLTWRGARLDPLLFVSE